MNVDLMLKTLPIMAKGMAGVFVVTLALLLCMRILNRMGGGKR